MASIELDQVLYKAWADKRVPEVRAAPVSAVMGVSDGLGDVLMVGLGIKTVADLAVFI
ncbi:hypothetical protein H4F94_00405 [Streptomyces sp. SP18CM02]|nr:hypothetical protein [Streptomyces sp. SP18CM02]